MMTPEQNHGLEVLDIWTRMATCHGTSRLDAYRRPGFVGSKAEADADRRPHPGTLIRQLGIWFDCWICDCCCGDCCWRAARWSGNCCMTWNTARATKWTFFESVSKESKLEQGWFCNYRLHSHRHWCHWITKAIWKYHLAIDTMSKEWKQGHQEQWCGHDHHGRLSLRQLNVINHCMY